MKTLNLPKASPVGAEIIKSVQINIKLDIPKTMKTINGVRNYYEHQAQRLADALLQALPQGMIEPLMIRLMQKRISIYRGLMNKE